MPDSHPRRDTVLRGLFVLFWTGLSGVAAVGVALSCFFIAGVVQFAWLDCGPRSSWGQVSYAACSDINETQPIVLVISLLALAPMAFALSLLHLRRRLSPNRPSLFGQGSIAVIGKIVVAVSAIAAAVFLWIWLQDLRLVLSLCPSQTVPDPCPIRWFDISVLAAIVVVFLIAPCVFGLKRLRRAHRHRAVAPRR